VKPVQLLTHLVAGRRAKWGVLGLWLIVLVALGSLAGKLNGAERTTALPGCRPALSQPRY
jgi:hypothetical protein